MDLLAQDVNTITFQDVVAFCNQQIVESTELDYKQIIPRDLTKHFAAMSNRFGGLIIVGVEEDPQTGLPVMYEGLVNDGKLIDRVHQFANNVRPLPSYHVRTTDEVDGKVFVLIRISEGGAPPYTPKNDPTVYLRTGNITTPLERADVDIVRDLYSKRTNAETERRDNAGRAFVRLLVRLEQSKAASAQAKTAPDGSEHESAPELPAPGKLRYFTSYLQPFYPHHELTQPRTIFAKLDNLRVMHNNSGRYFPSMQMRPIARGMFSFERRQQNQAFSCDQIYANGLYVHSESLARPWTDWGDDILVADIARNLYTILLFGRGLFYEVGYSGLTRGALVLERASGARIIPIWPSGRRHGGFFDSDLPRAIDDAYSWPIEADTHQLSDDDWLNTYFYERMREICWDLGVDDLARATMDEYLKESAFNR